MSYKIVIMTIYYFNIRHNRYYYDNTELHKELAIWVDGAQGMKDMRATMLWGPVFIGKDRKMHDNRQRSRNVLFRIHSKSVRW